jgi:hypothetical protein
MCIMSAVAARAVIRQLLLEGRDDVKAVVELGGRVCAYWVCVSCQQGGIKANTARR